MTSPTDTLPPVATDHHAQGMNNNHQNGLNDYHNGYQKPSRFQPNFADITSGWAQPSGGALQPGHWKPYEHRKLANPAPLGLCAFALTTFVLSAVNMHARDVTAPNIVVPLALGYGGLVQLLAGMWYVTTQESLRLGMTKKKMKRKLIVWWH